MSPGDQMSVPSRQQVPELRMTFPSLGVPSVPVDPAFAGAGSAKLSATSLNFYYGAFQALRDISMQVYDKRVTAFIGPSGCGKSTFLRTLNRMNETVRHSRVEGDIRLDGEK